MRIGKPARSHYLVGAAVLLVAAAAFGLWKLRKPPETAGPVSIAVQPQTVWIERSDHQQSLNFDFVIENRGPTPLGLDRIELAVLDEQGQPVLRRFIDGNGFAPSIETIAGRVVAPGARILVFNPFHAFRPDAPLRRLQYRFHLSIPGEAPETQADVEVKPREFAGKTRLSLPVKGLLLIHDGHDFYAHHRRLDTTHPVAQSLGVTHNFMRYSLDINSTNEAFEPFKGSGAANDDWFAWGQPVLATADGTVVDAADAEPDNVRGGKNHFDPARVKSEPMHFYGNHVVLDHGNGEFSLYGHLQRGSLAVKTGDRVTRGQVLARIGSSGSSNNPHLHYELRSGRGLQVDGLPAVFHDYERVLGARRQAVDAGPVDTGDLLRAR